jgi:hypothetical protein
MEVGHLAVPGCSQAQAQAVPGAIQQSLALADGIWIMSPRGSRVMSRNNGIQIGLCIALHVLCRVDLSYIEAGSCMIA